MRWVALGMAAATACTGGGGEAEQTSGHVANWEQRRDSVAVSIESPAHEQQIDQAWVQPLGGPRIPMRKQALQIDFVTDFACVKCGEVEEMVRQLLWRMPVHSRRIVHFPGRESPWSMEAAQAFECAYDDGQAKEMYEVLRRHTEDFSEVTWDSIAREAQVYDTAEFRRCRQGPTRERVTLGIAAARALGLHAAPAVLIDGWLVSPLTKEALDAALVRAVEARRKVY